MTVRECVVRGPIASEHIVQFFDSDESRAECVAEFLAEGIRLEEPAIVVAKPTNWVMAVGQLESRGVPGKDALADGMIVVKKAEDTLRRLSRNGSPDATAVQAGIRKASARLARPRPRLL